MEARVFTKQELHRNAAIVVAIIAIFSVCLILGVRHLDGIARLMLQSQSDGSVVGDVYSKVDDEMSAATDCPTEPFYVLLIGSDTRQGTALYTGKSTEDSDNDDHADIITLMRVDPTNWQITLVSIPRDTVLSGQKKKINDTLLGNHPEKTVRAVEELTGVHIDYYLLTTFLSFEHLIDDLGGVTVDVPQDISFADPITAENVTVKAGKNQQLNGSQALVLARVRKAYGDAGDVKRQENVRNIEIAIIQKCIQHPELAASVQGNMDSYVDTNMDADILYSLILDFVKNGEEIEFYSCTGPFDGGERADGVWVIEADKEAWMALMAVVDAGDDPSHALEDFYQERAAASSAGQQAQREAEEDQVETESNNHEPDSDEEDITSDEVVSNDDSNEENTV